MKRFFHSEAPVTRYVLHSLRFGGPAAFLMCLVAGCAGNNSGPGPGPGNEMDLAAPCIGPKCGDPNGCDKESDCDKPERPHCEVMSHKCVPCLTDLDCELGKLCF